MATDQVRLSHSGGEEPGGAVLLLQSLPHHLPPALVFIEEVLAVLDTGRLVTALGRSVDTVQQRPGNRW